jgi:hypothetical protein
MRPDNSRGYEHSIKVIPPLQPSQGVGGFDGGVPVSLGGVVVEVVVSVSTGGVVVLAVVSPAEPYTIFILNYFFLI